MDRTDVKSRNDRRKAMLRFALMIPLTVPILLPVRAAKVEERKNTTTATLGDGGSEVVLRLR